MQAVREVCDEVLAGVKLNRVGLVAASGMLTSELGLCEIRHVPAPVSVEELAARVHVERLPELGLPVPVHFVPGVKNLDESKVMIDLENAHAMDAMRGEESEVFGVMARCGLHGPAVMVMPGSHTVFVFVDGEDRITGCTTTMAGELLEEMTSRTVLAQALESRYVDAIETDWLRTGAQGAERLGLSRCGYIVRMLDRFTGATRNQKANYLLGAVLQGDLQALCRAGHHESDFYVFGDSGIARGLHLLLEQHFSHGERVHSLAGEATRDIAGFGALHIARLSQEWNGTMRKTKEWNTGIVS